MVFFLVLRDVLRAIRPLTVTYRATSSARSAAGPELSTLSPVLNGEASTALDHSSVVSGLFPTGLDPIVPLIIALSG